MTKKMIGIVCLCLFFLPIHANDGIGPDAAYPILEKEFKKLPIKENELYSISEKELEHIIGIAADIQINLFELLDCCYRYLAPRNMRIEIQGSSFRNLQQFFDYGGERILGLIPIHKMIKVQTGACFTKNEKAFDMYLDSNYSRYIEIVTAMYKARCGFEKMDPRLFSEAYGMRVKKWGMRLDVSKIHLYENGKGALHAKKFYRPKRWYLNIITRIPKKNTKTNTEVKDTSSSTEVTPSPKSSSETEIIKEE